MSFSVLYEAQFFRNRQNYIIRNLSFKLGVANNMKNGIHPEYAETSIRCACGSEIKVGSTRSDIRVEICSKCHPFFTGKQKLVDTAGRIERFRKKYEKFQKQEKPT